MSKLWQGIAAAHDTAAGFGHLSHHILGIPYYSDRALLLPADLAFISHDGEDVESHIAHLKKVGMGPKQAVFVKGANLFDGLDDDPIALDRLKDHFRAGGLFQVFCNTERSEEFYRRHSIPPKRIHSAPRSIADRMNDKAELRRIAYDCGIGHAVLPHVATRDPQAVMAAVKRFRAMPRDECEFPVLKPTNRAGGDGFMRVDPVWSDAEVEERVRDYLRANSWNELAVTAHSELKREAGQALALDRAEVRDIGRDVDEGVAKLSALIDGLIASVKEEHAYVVVSRRNSIGGASLKVRSGVPYAAELQRFLLDQCRNEIIVEAGFEHDAYSTQVVVDHGEYRFLGPTKQIVDASGRHMGNIMVRFYDASLEAKGLTFEDKQVMESFSYDLTRYAHTRVEGYRGTIGFDFLKRRRDGRIFVLECNARQTAATYPLAVSAQLEGRVCEPLAMPKGERMNWGVVMHNAVPTRARSWGALTDRLGGLLYAGGLCGALPFNVRLMRLEEPHVGIVAVGETLDRALAVMRLARRKLIR